MVRADFWNNQKDAEGKTNQLSAIKGELRPVLELKEKVKDLRDYQEISELSADESMVEEYQNLYLSTKKLLEEVQIMTYLGGKFVKNNAIFEIHAGAGGTESCDWTVMLSRMYTKYFDKKGYKYEIIEEQAGEETGLKSIVYLVRGTYAYGYLKNEKGVHRLVRLSPFDSNNRRHTSFAAVDVTPEFAPDVDVELKEQDVRIDVYRSSGAGGQGVNTTDSAVRVTHLPTGIVVTCQNERSQIKNKETALKILRSKLYQIKLKEQQEKLDAMKSDHSGIEFGSQIRSYVLHPYSMIKDHRTNCETANVTKVLDGYLDEFIESNLKGERQ